VPRYPESFIQQVAQATDLVELVSTYIALKRKGKEFVGLCPFHDDKNPSLNVSAAKQIFKCFSCGAGGGVFQWLMMYDKLSFPEAVETLAERSNIPLPHPSGPAMAATGPSKRDLAGICSFADAFFRKQLRSPAGAAGLEYVRRRGLTDESLDRFGVGFAPDSWDALLKSARAAGIGEGQLVAAGLVVKRESGGCYDRFRNRLILPIFDVSARVIGFGGRAMSDEQRAKYLNSPESPLFDKSSQLYALNWARQEIVRSGQAVVVEGYFDAIIPMQAGVGNVVATMGTALTDRHVRMLSRYAKEVVLVFDADEAGAAAAERAMEVFLQQRLNVRIVTIPDGKDPCDYVSAHGAEAFGQLLAQAPDALAYIWDKRKRAMDAGASPAEKNAHVEDFLRLVAASEAYGAIDEVRRGQLADHIGHLLNIPAVDLQQQLGRLARRGPRQRARPGVPSGGGPRISQGPHAHERLILEVLLNCPEQFDAVAERIDPHHFADPDLRRVAEGVWHAAEGDCLSLEELLATEDLADLGPLLADLAAAGAHRGNYVATSAGAVDVVARREGREETEELKRSSFISDEALRQLPARLRSPDLTKRPKIR